MLSSPSLSAVWSVHPTFWHLRLTSDENQLLIVFCVDELLPFNHILNFYFISLPHIHFAGTSACACALSASFDSLSGGAIGRSIASSIGTVISKYCCPFALSNIHHHLPDRCY